MRLAAASIAIGVLLAACGGPASGAGPTATGGGASASLAPVVVQLVAKDLELTPAVVHVPAGSPLSVRFDNRDAGVPHGLQLEADTAPPTAIMVRPVAAGPNIDQFDVPGLIAGSYRFSCQVHPMMVVELAVDQP